MCTAIVAEAPIPPRATQESLRAAVVRIHDRITTAVPPEFRPNLTQNQQALLSGSISELYALANSGNVQIYAHARGQLGL